MVLIRAAATKLAKPRSKSNIDSQDLDEPVGFASGDPPEREHGPATGCTRAPQWCRRLRHTHAPEVLSPGPQCWQGGQPAAATTSLQRSPSRASPERPDPCPLRPGRSWSGRKTRAEQRSSRPGAETATNPEVGREDSSGPRAQRAADRAMQFLCEQPVPVAGLPADEDLGGVVGRISVAIEVKRYEVVRSGDPGESGAVLQ
jgi:hypothetical protein